VILTGDIAGHARGVRSREGMPPACPCDSPVTIIADGYYCLSAMIMTGLSAKDLRGF